VNIEALRIAPGENIKRLLDFGGLRQKTLGHRQQPYTRRAHLLRSGALGSIVRTALGGQRRHFSTHWNVFGMLYHLDFRPNPTCERRASGRKLALEIGSTRG
jgi:hypothetical protein